VWLNLAPDHLDWHGSTAGYEEAKARLWDHQRPADAAICNTDDPIVMSRLAVAPGRHVIF
jgi:UDP-N-acetylmuramoylalanine--D-glutamate ligase